jgi:hypothetical protein
LQCALPGPVRQQFVTTAALTVGSLRRGKQRQDRHTGVSTMKLNQRSPLALTK